jgi:hypothetical protein
MADERNPLGNAWLLLKSSEGGAQSLLYAAMEATLGRGAGGKLLKECQEMDFARSDVKDEIAAKKLWEGSEKLIERVEREEAVRRALEKKEKEELEKSTTKTDKAGPEAASTEAETAKPKSRRQRKAK